MTGANSDQYGMSAFGLSFGLPDGENYFWRSRGTVGDAPEDGHVSSTAMETSLGLNDFDYL